MGKATSCPDVQRKTGTFRAAGALLSVFLLLAMTACGGNGRESALMEDASSDMSGAAAESYRAAKSIAPAPSPVPDQVVGNDQQIQLESPKIIREGRITFETSDLKKTRSWIDSLVRHYEGYLAEDQQNRFDDRIEELMVIRVPADSFSLLVADLEKSVGRFDSKTVSARDVTEEFIDVSQRLRVKKETEKRYLDILTRAGTVHDILEVERYIGQVRAEIESLEGRLKYLENRIGFSTLTVTFYQLKPQVLGFSSQFGVALHDGWNNFMFFLLGAVSLWPFLLAGILLIVVLFLVGSLRR